MSAASSKPWWRRWFGSRSERAVERHLRKFGYSILARNFRCPLGEIDIIAVDRSCIVFVEVRSTGASATDRPAESVGPAKQRQLTRLALYYLKRKRLLERPARFDVAIVSWPDGAKAPHIEHIQHAFEATGRFQFFG